MIRRRHAFGLVLLALLAPACRADIYAYIDKDGRGHYSDVRLDSRYQLYMKTKPAAPAAPVASDATNAAQTSAALARPIPLKARRRYAEMIAKVAREQKLEPALIHAVVTVESGYNANARSPKGATGLMQVMPATGKRYGITNLRNPLENLRAGARYLRDLIELFGDNLQLAIAAYNAGEGSVIRSGNAIPNYPETRAYVPRVLRYYETYKAQKS